MKRLFLAACFLALACARADAQVDYPSGALPLVSSFLGADTGGVGLNIPYGGPSPPNKTVYMCGFSVNGLGATALTNVLISFNNLQRGDGVVTPLIFQYQYPAGATVIAVPVTVTFTPCLVAVTSNMQIGISVPGAAGNTSTNVSLWGYAK
jgi:hypothetical protein